MKHYTVWVGGTEVTNHLVTLQDAIRIKYEYIADGYDDVIIEMVEA